jgi:spore germination protein KB
LNNKIITNHQLFTFTALSTLGGSILVVSSIVTGIARQNAWISVLVTMVFGLAMMWLYCFLASRYEGLTLIGLAEKIFGKWIGKIVAVGYFAYIFITAYDIPWYIGSFHSNIKHETPVAVLIVLFYTALAIAVHYGIETIARASEIFFHFNNGVFDIVDTACRTGDQIRVCFARF